MLSKSEYAYQKIKEMILVGELAPKADISEKQLQDALEVGRTPIHEALKRLEDEGFTETYSRKGTFVTDITMETVRDLYETRLLIEPYITRDAVGIIPAERLENLLERLKEAHSFATMEDVHEVMKLDTELHTMVASYCSNTFLRKSLQLVYEHDRRIRLKTDRNPAQVRFSQGEHVALVTAMLEGDKERTQRLSREHVLNSRNLTYESLGFIDSGRAGKQTP